MATFLVRTLQFLGVPLPGASGDYFADDELSIHEVNINRVAAAGIAAGVSGASYQPDGRVRRDQMASFLARALDYLVEQAGTPVPPVA